MKLKILLTAAILAPLWLTTPVEAQIIFRSPNSPDIREGGRGNPPSDPTSPGGTRSSSAHLGKPLTALIPPTQVGLTVAEYPTFFVYVPQTSGQKGEFALLNKDDNVVYETNLTLPSSPGIVSVSLPAKGTLAPLEIGKVYRWYFGIINDPNDRSKDNLVKGSIQRVQPSTDLSQKLAAATPQNRPAVYAEAGIWHDALASLAELRHSKPDNAIIASQWKELLQSESVRLNQVAEEPLLESLSEKTPVQPLGSQTGKPDSGERGLGAIDTRELGRSSPSSPSSPLPTPPSPTPGESP